MSRSSCARARKAGARTLSKNGHNYKGSQKYHCHDCGAYGTLDKKRHIV